MIGFDIRDYIWNIFEISSTENVSARIAFDMFTTNMELGCDRYKGATDIDYARLSKKWNALNNIGHKHQKYIFNNILNNFYSLLCKTWMSNDRLMFRILCFIESI